MTTTDQLRAFLRDLEAKAKERELDKKITTFADQADHLLREAASRAGEYAAENRQRVEGVLDKAEAAVDSRTEGKYHRTLDKLRTGVLTGVDWVAEQRESAPAGGPAPAAAAAGSATPTSAAGSTTSATGPDSSTAADSTTAAAATMTPTSAAGTPTPDAGRTASSGSTSAAWGAATDTPTTGGSSTPATHDPVTEGPTDPR